MASLFESLWNRPRRGVWPAVSVLVSIVACGGDAGREVGPDGEAAGAAEESAVQSEPSEEARIGGLEVALDVGRQRVEGSLEGVRFEASAEGEEGARARFWWEGDEGPGLGVAIEGPATGWLEWAGGRLDGYGALEAGEVEALEGLEEALPAMKLARIPLDLACREGAGELSPAVGAALVMPTQMLLKYRTPSSHVAEAIARMAAQSECQHFRGPLDPIDPARTPAPGIVALSDEAPIPMAAGYFPFGEEPLDGEGQR